MGLSQHPVWGPVVVVEDGDFCRLLSPAMAARAGRILLDLAWLTTLAIVLDDRLHLASSDQGREELQQLLEQLHATLSPHDVEYRR